MGGQIQRPTGAGQTQTAAGPAAEDPGFPGALDRDQETGRYTFAADPLVGCTWCTLTADPLARCEPRPRDPIRLDSRRSLQPTDARCAETAPT